MNQTKTAATDNTYPVLAYLDCSVSHLSKKTMEMLNQGEQEGLAITIAPYTFGAFVSVPLFNDPGETIAERLPADLHQVLKFASDRNCIIVRFDTDGDIIDGLPVYDWETRDEFVPCAMCNVPEATTEVPFCGECLPHVVRVDEALS